MIDVFYVYQIQSVEMPNRTYVEVYSGFEAADEGSQCGEECFN